MKNECMRDGYGMRFVCPQLKALPGRTALSCEHLLVMLFSPFYLQLRSVP